MAQKQEKSTPPSYSSAEYTGKKLTSDDLEKMRQMARSPTLKLAKNRSDTLRQLETLIRSNEETILNALATDLGKPTLEAYLSEIYFTLEELKYMRRNLPGWSTPKHTTTGFFNQPASSWIKAEGKGVVCIFAPWNYPFRLTIGPALGAIAAGNAVVLKPSELTPRTSDVIATLINKNFDPNIIRVVLGSVDVAKSLAALPFDHIFFTGGQTAAKSVMSAAANNLTPVTLELGGKNPCIVDKNVKLELTCKRILLGKLFNAGQTCVAPDFILVHESNYKGFVDQCKQQLQAFYPDQRMLELDLTKIINAHHFDRLSQLVTGDRWQQGNSRRDKLVFAPTLLLNANWQQPCMQDEIFGPVLPIIKYKDIDKVLAELNRRPKPLSLYVFSNRSKFRDEVLENTSSGNVCVNDTVKQITNFELPFGGVGPSGMGAYHGKHSFDCFSHHRSYMKRPLYWDFFSSYPPYRDSFEKLRRFLK